MLTDANRQITLRSREQCQVDKRTAIRSALTRYYKGRRRELETAIAQFDKGDPNRQAPPSWGYELNQVNQTLEALAQEG